MAGTSHLIVDCTIHLVIVVVFTIVDQRAVLIQLAMPMSLTMFKFSIVAKLTIINDVAMSLGLIVFNVSNRDTSFAENDAKAFKPVLFIVIAKIIELAVRQIVNFCSKLVGFFFVVTDSAIICVSGDSHPIGDKISRTMCDVKFKIPIPFNVFCRPYSLSFISKPSKFVRA